jgi:hypothetical protein
MLKPVLVTALIFERPTCAACASTLADCTAPEVLATVDALKSILPTFQTVARCWKCGNVDTLYSVGRPESA